MASKKHGVKWEIGVISKCNYVRKYNASRRLPHRSAFHDLNTSATERDSHGRARIGVIGKPEKNFIRFEDNTQEPIIIKPPGDELMITISLPIIATHHATSCACAMLGRGVAAPDLAEESK